MESSYAYMKARNTRAVTNEREGYTLRANFHIYIPAFRADVLTYGALVDAPFCNGGPG